MKSEYRTRANKWRSQLGASPLRIQAKIDFLMSFLCDNLRVEIMISEYKLRHLSARVRLLFRFSKTLI